MKPFAALLALATIMFFPSATRAEEGKLRMHVINVGQAESILIEMPNHALLIDAAGEDTERDTTAEDFYRGKLRQYLDDFFADNPHLNNTLDALILSHPHADHTKYLTFILNRYSVRHFIASQGSICSPGSLQTLSRTAHFLLRSCSLASCM